MINLEAIEQIALRKVCIVQYATYRFDPEVQAELARWRVDFEKEAASQNGSAAPAFLMIEKFNDVTILYAQTNISGEPTPEQVAEARPNLKAVPIQGRIGLTLVVQARCPSAASATVAQLLLKALTGIEHCMTCGGKVAPDVDLWARRYDPAWLVVLYDDLDTAESTADWLLLGPLWNHEVVCHKAQDQFHQFQHARRRFVAKRRALRDAIDELSAMLNRPGRSNRAEELPRYRKTVRERRRLNETVSRLRRMSTSLEAHRANLQAMRLQLGASAGLEALELRRQNLNLWIEQIYVEQHYAQPELEAALDICSEHRDMLLDNLNETEKKENRLRDRSNKLLALLGLWIGLMQLISSVWTTNKESPTWSVLMALWTIIGIVGVSAWWLRANREAKRETTDRCAKKLTLLSRRIGYGNPTGGLQGLEGMASDAGGEAQT